MKRFIIVLCFIPLLALSCETVTATVVGTFPRSYSFDGTKEFIILGEIIYESDMSSGYIDLLKEARKIYPSCDYIIDILRDEKIITTGTRNYLPSGNVESTYYSHKTTWIMRGMAIQFINNDLDRMSDNHIPSVTVSTLAVGNKKTADETVPESENVEISSNNIPVDNIYGAYTVTAFTGTVRRTTSSRSGNTQSVNIGNILNGNQTVRISSASSLTLQQGDAVIVIPENQNGTVSSLVTKFSEAAE